MSQSSRSLPRHATADRGAPGLTRGLLVAALLLAGCTVRPLSDAETAFLATTHGADLDTADIRIAKGAFIGRIPIERAPRPAVACRELIWPPETGDTVTGHVAGMVLYDRLMISRWFYRDDLLDGYPDRLPLSDAMFLAHEATHIWQWQHAQKTGYAPWKAAAEHQAQDDPYLFTINDSADFLDYGYEQQASLVEEYVCCRALDPAGARTARLRALLTPVFPNLAQRETADSIQIPWEHAQTRDICG